MKTEIKELVAEGKLDEALDRLVAYLESQTDQFSSLYRAARVAQSEFNQSKEKELQGILSEDQIRLSNNLAINRILEILEQLERRPSPTPSTAMRNKWWWYAAGGAGAVFAVFFIWKVFTPNQNVEPEQPLTPTDSTLVVEKPPFPCPSFDEEAEYSIAIFNFTTLDPKDSIADKFLVEEIDAIFLRNRFNGDATLVEKINVSVDAAVAKSMIKNCRAKMIIWGRVFETHEIDLNFYAPSINNEQQDALDSELQFREQGNFQASIKQAALIIASRVLVMNKASGAVAVSEEAYEKTVKKSTTTTSAKTKPKSSESMATMTLANAHASRKDYKKSIQYYDELLRKNTKDTVARKNLAIVQIKVNDVASATKTIDTLRQYKKVEDPVFLDKAGDALQEKGWTRKGAELKRDAKQAIQDQKVVPKILPKE